MPDLRSKLKAAQEAWCKAHDAPASRLGKLVASDAAFFDRVEGRNVLPCTVATLEKFARFLVDPVNWPEGKVADEAKALAHAVVGTTPAPGASAGKPGETSSQREKAA